MRVAVVVRAIGRAGDLSESFAHPTTSTCSQRAVDCLPFGVFKWKTRERLSDGKARADCVFRVKGAGVFDVPWTYEFDPLQRVQVIQLSGEFNQQPETVPSRCPGDSRPIIANKAMGVCPELEVCIPSQAASRGVQATLKAVPPFYQTDLWAYVPHLVFPPYCSR